MSGYEHSIILSRDVDDHATIVESWDQQYDQVSAGRFAGRLEDLSLGPVQVIRETLNQALVMRGAPAPGTIVLAAAVMDAPGWFDGRLIDENHTVRLMANSEFECVTRGGIDLFTVGVELDYLSDYARRVDRIEIDWRPLQAQVLGEDAGRSRALREMLIATMATVRDSPRLLEHESLRRALAQSICDEIIASGNQPAPKSSSVDMTVATRQRVVREARHYMSQHADEAISVPDLCEAIHVSRRTLQYSFQDVLQMSPVAYLRALRLNGMRRDLRRGGTESVGDRAARWGFWHLSRFAADYCYMFGELPSQTLQRARSPGASR